MSTDVGLSILGAPGSGRTTLCQRLNDHTYLRACDGRRFRFKAQEADLDSPRLLENSNIILMTFGLDTEYAEYGQWVIRFGRLVRNEYWEQRGAFHIIGTKYNALEPGSEYVKHPGGLTTMITLYTSISSAIIDTLSGSGIEALCCSLANRAHPIGPSIGSRLHKAYEGMKSWGLDLVALIFSLSVPPNINHDTPDSDDLPVIQDDNTAWEMIKTPDAIAYNRRLAAYSDPLFNWAPTFKIAPTLILKRLSPSERFNNTFVRSHTTIPVPQPRYLHLKEVMITDFIPGAMLLECWNSLSSFYQFRIACTLRTYVSQMRRVTCKRPGSIEKGLVKGPVFDPDLYNGPFCDAETFRNWIAHVAYIGWTRKDEEFRNHNPGRIPPPPPPQLNFPADCDWSPVLTHCDLSLGNVMLSDDGILWIIDWADSGFYPPWIESRGMRRYEAAPESWKRWYSFISGSSCALDVVWSYFIKEISIFASDVPNKDYWPPPM